MKLIIFSFIFFSQVIHSEDCSTGRCGPRLSSISQESENLISSTTRATLKLLCDKEYNPEDWEEVTKNFNFYDLTEEQKYIIIQKLMKQKKFQGKHDKRILVEILYDTELVNKYKKEILLLAQHDEFNKILNHEHFDFLENEQQTFFNINDEESCHTKRERDNIRQSVFIKMYELAKQSASHCKESKYLYRTIPSLIKLEENKRTEIINILYRGYGACLASRWEIPISKALVFTKSYVYSLFSKKQELITDLTTNFENEAIILSNKEIKKSSSASSKEFLGVYLQRPTVQNMRIEWETNGSKFRAKMSQTEVSLKNYIRKDEDAPPYALMWADKEFTGMTLISPNLGPEWREKVTNNYISYYVDKGFEFSEPVEVADSKDWIENQITSGEIDYILKEAHTEGNTTDLLGISSTHRIMTGVKKNSDGTKEVMHILMPQDSKQVRLTFLEMNKWMGKRKQNNQGPLIYLNSSCWSMQQASSEIAGVSSDLFINIASTGTTTTFFNGKNSTKYQIMEGIRERKNYRQILEAMATTTRHKNGYNDFLFPNQETYSNALKANEPLLHTTFEITDEQGTPYALHQALK